MTTWKPEDFWPPKVKDEELDLYALAEKQYGQIAKILDHYHVPEAMSDGWLGTWSPAARVAWLGADAEERKEIEAVVQEEYDRRFPPEVQLEMKRALEEYEESKDRFEAEKVFSAVLKRTQW